MNRTTTLGALALCLLWSASASAQELQGEYSLFGRYSNRRHTRATLKVAQTPEGLSVTRTGRYTSQRHKNKPAFTWTSKLVTRKSPRIYEVVYSLDKDGADLGASQRLSEQELYDEGRKGSVLKGYYFLNSDGSEARELIVNSTRRGSEGWWYWIRTNGPRVGGGATGFLDGFRDRGVTDPSLYYHFGVAPRDLPALSDDEVIAKLRSNPTDPLMGRIALVRTYIWESLTYRLDNRGHLPANSAGTWRTGEVTDPTDGQSYSVVHWRDIDDNSFSVYFKDGKLYSIYYEN